MKVQFLICKGSIKSEPKNMKAERRNFVLIKRIKDDQARLSYESRTAAKSSVKKREMEIGLNGLKAKLLIKCALSLFQYK